MTEELKKEEYDLIIRFKSNKPKYEIRDYIIKHTLNDFDNLQMWDFKRSGEFAESKEKQIEIDAEQIRNLQKQNGELTDKVRELEQQIEKMKCCGNCTKGNCVNNGQIGKACAYWTSNKIRR